jgi:hypothetical protein
MHPHTATVSDGETQASSLIGQLLFIALATQFFFSEIFPYCKTIDFRPLLYSDAPLCRADHRGFCLFAVSKSHFLLSIYPRPS